jgi:hypothetical protein
MLLDIGKEDQWILAVREELTRSHFGRCTEPTSKGALIDDLPSTAAVLRDLTR